jgi:hypothetical protein
MLCGEIDADLKAINLGKIRRLYNENSARYDDIHIGAIGPFGPRPRVDHNQRRSLII